MIGNTMHTAVRGKCCWCCDRLAYHLGEHLKEEFNLPGKHGTFYAWSPPTIGIDVAELKALEQDLWDELKSVSSSRAQQGSRSSIATRFRRWVNILDKVYRGDFLDEESSD